MPTSANSSFSVSRLKSAPEPSNPNAGSKPSIASSLFSGFNINSIFLLIVIALLTALVFKPSLFEPEYEYIADLVTDSSLSSAVEIRNREMSRKIGKPFRYQSAYLQDVFVGRGMPERTEYVGLLRHGAEGTWVLVRWPKK